MPYRFWNNEDGAMAIEYGLIAVVISLAILGALTQLNTTFVATWTNIGTEMSRPIAHNP